MLRPLLFSSSSSSRPFNGKLRNHDVHVYGWAIVSFHPEGTIADYCRLHEWRKRGSGMITDLIAQWPVDAPRSLLIGDKQSDIERPENGAIRGFLFEGGSLDDLAEPIEADLRIFAFTHSLLLTPVLQKLQQLKICINAPRINSRES
jgi:histidinol phosphatase-like enzyme